MIIYVVIWSFAVSDKSKSAQLVFSGAPKTINIILKREGGESESPINRINALLICYIRIIISTLSLSLQTLDSLFPPPPAYLLFPLTSSLSLQKKKHLRALSKLPRCVAVVYLIRFKYDFYCLSISDYESTPRGYGADFT